MALWVILIAYLVLMTGIGIFCRKSAGNVNDFVLGGRNIGPWFTAFAYGTSYFRLWCSSAMQDSSAGPTAHRQHG